MGGYNSEEFVFQKGDRKIRAAGLVNSGPTGSVVIYFGCSLLDIHIYVYAF
jgi:hypothetical protein